MNKHKLLKWVKSPESMASSDLKKLEEVQKEYPFFSVAYSLTARLKYKEQSADAKQALGIAALYTADRHVLKEFVIGAPKPAPTPPPIPKEEAKPAEQKPTKEAPAKAQETAKKAPTPPPLPEEPKAPTPEETSAIRRIVFDDEPKPSNHLADSFYEDLEDNLKNLHAQRKALDMWIHLKEGTDDEYTEEAPEIIIPPILRKSQPKIEETYEEVDDSTVAEEESTPEPEIAEPTPEPKAEDKTPEPETPADTESKPSATPPPLPESAKAAPARAPQGEELLRGLEKRAMLEHPDGWQKEQTAMIDRFLAEEPTLRQKGNQDPKSPNQPQEDLSIKSQTFGDNIISENLARILTKQGKIDKAIEIYRKLIWKFPQKKGYFADLIEKLKEGE